MTKQQFQSLFFPLFLLLFSFLLSAQPSLWMPKGIGGGGSLFAPSINPHQTDEVFIVCDMSEMFRTENAGQSWKPLYFDDFRGVTSASMQFTSDPNILYGVSMDDFRLEDIIPLKSTNGGTSWTPINDPTTGDVFFLFADPNSTDRLILGSYYRMYFSDDAGISFTQVFEDNDGGLQPLHIGGVFWDGDLIFVGTQAGLVISTNGGQSFQLDNSTGLPSNFGLLSFAGAKSNSSIRLMAVARHQADMWPGMIPGEEYWDNDSDVYRLDWGTGNWALANNGIPTDAFPFFIGMAKDDINTVYVSGATQNPVDPMVYKSVNGGNNWTNVFQTSNNQNIQTGWIGDSGDLEWSWAECAMGFSVCSGDSDVAIITDFGFAHITYDGGANWQQMFVNASDANTANNLTPNGKAYQSNGLENTSSWWLHWSDSDNVFAGYSDITGVRSTDGGNKWSFDYSGNDYNSTYCIVEHPSTGTLYAAVSSTHDIYQSTHLRDSNLDEGEGAILYSTDKGASWQVLHEFLNANNSSNTVIWLAFDPSNSNTMYASVIHSSNGGIFKTTDLQNGTSATWTRTTSPTRTQGHPFNIHILNDGTLVATFSGRRTSGGAFTQSSGVFYSEDGGTNWQDRSDNGMLYWTKDIVIDPHDSNQNTWYACVFSGWGGAGNTAGGVYKTTNRGLSWSKINNRYRVNSVSIHPEMADVMYVTTEDEGLWYSDNLTAATPTFSQQTVYPFQQPMRVFFNPNNSDEVWVTSFGNGIKMGSTMILATEWIDFQARPMKDFIQLNWKAQSDNQLMAFEVERKTNTTDFQKIEHLRLPFNASTIRTYAYKDVDVKDNTTYYYRIKSINRDGSAAYSSIQSAQLRPYSAQVVLFPNPTTTFSTLEVKSVEDYDEVLIINSLGQNIQHIPLLQKQTKIDMTSFPNGTYQLVLQKEGKVLEVVSILK